MRVGRKLNNIYGEFLARDELQSEISAPLETKIVVKSTTLR